MVGRELLSVGHGDWEEAGETEYTGDVDSSLDNIENVIVDPSVIKLAYRLLIEPVDAMITPLVEEKDLKGLITLLEYYYLHDLPQFDAAWRLMTLLYSSKAQEVLALLSEKPTLYIQNKSLYNSSRDGHGF